MDLPILDSFLISVGEGEKMKRTRKLLAAFVPPVVAGVAVGVCGASDANRSADNAASAEPNVVEVREKTPENTANLGPSVIEAGEKKADNNNEDLDDKAVAKAAAGILAVLPAQPVDRSKWVTKDDLSKKLPGVKSELLDAALNSMKEDRQIAVYKDDSGTLRYARSYDDEAIEKASKEILAILPKPLVERSKWMTKDDLSKKLTKIESELLNQTLDSLKEDRQVATHKDDSGVWRYAQSYSDETVEEAGKEILAVLLEQPVDRSKWATRDDLSKKLPKVEPELLDAALDSLREDDKIILAKDDSGALHYGKKPTRQG
jgi:hypothetical protein